MGRWKCGQSWRWLFTLCIVAIFGPVAALAGQTINGNGRTAVFAFDSSSGQWQPVNQGDDRVEMSFAGKSFGGACDKENWPNHLKVRTEVQPFKNDFIKTATPLTGNIQVLRDGSFQVPLFQTASWRVVIRVTNNHSSPRTDLRVIDNFGAEFGVTPGKPSQGLVETDLSGNAEKVHLVWDIGTLAAGESAELNLTVTTDQNPAGRQEFTSPGKYELNPGATLFYRLNGIIHEETTGPLFVYATGDEDGEPLENGLSGEHSSGISIIPLAVSGFGDLSRVETEGGSSPIRFKEEFIPVTPSISPKPAQGGFRDGFEVPEDTHVEWILRLTIQNTQRTTMTDLRVTEHLGAELAIDRSSIKKTPANSRFDYRRRGNIDMEWRINSLRPGDQAVLEVNVYTRQQNGRQQYAEPTPPGAPNYLNSGATLKYYEPYTRSKFSTQCHRQRSIILWSVPVWVGDKPVLKVVLSAAQYFWQIRKPGIYAADPAELSVFSNRRVMVTFSDFADLAAESGSLPTLYGVGDSLKEVERNGWYTAAKWNQVKFTTQSSQVGTTAVWKIWPRIEISGRTRAGRYSDTGKLTVTVLETQPYVQNSGEDGKMGVKGFNGIDFADW